MLRCLIVVIVSCSINAFGGKSLKTCVLHILETNQAIAALIAKVAKDQQAFFRQAQPTKIGGKAREFARRTLGTMELQQFLEMKVLGSDLPAATQRDLMARANQQADRTLEMGGGGSMRDRVLRSVYGSARPESTPYGEQLTFGDVPLEAYAPPSWFPADGEVGKSFLGPVSWWLSSEGHDDFASQPLEPVGHSWNELVESLQEIGIIGLPSAPE